MVTGTVSMHQGFIPFLYSWCSCNSAGLSSSIFPLTNTGGRGPLNHRAGGMLPTASKKRLAATSTIPHHLIIRDSTVTVLADAQSTAIVSFRLTFSREEQRCSPKVWTVSCHPLQAWFRGNAVSG